MNSTTAMVLSLKAWPFRLFVIYNIMDIAWRLYKTCSRPASALCVLDSLVILYILSRWIQSRSDHSRGSLEAVVFGMVEVVGSIVGTVPSSVYCRHIGRLNLTYDVGQPSHLLGCRFLGFTFCIGRSNKHVKLKLFVVFRIFRRIELYSNYLIKLSEVCRRWIWLGSRISHVC